jgi:hypothetical protein
LDTGQPRVLPDTDRIHLGMLDSVCFLSRIQSPSVLLPSRRLAGPGLGYLERRRA